MDFNIKNIPKIVSILIIGILVFVNPSLLQAQEKPLMLAQVSDDDSYDPFADYSDFEQSADEEEDENFFRNGRLLTVGMIMGYRGFLGNQKLVYSSNMGFGLFISYFFDLRFAMQFGFLSSDHNLSAKGPNETVSGSVGYQDFSISFKYFINTQNVTRGLADLNPYLIVGFSNTYRTISLSSQLLPAKDSGFGGLVGAGIEIPISRNKMYFGFQGLYEMIPFTYEGDIKESTGTTTGYNLAGSTYTILGILGVNF